MNDIPKGWLALAGVLLLLLIALAMWGCPSYEVWQQQKKGEAELSRAVQNRQIAVQEAQAKMESAKSLAQAEIERAKGVAEANRIIAEGLKNNEAYLWYLWLQGLDAISDHGGTVVYVPTEANLPIMEAGRFDRSLPKAGSK